MTLSMTAFARNDQETPWGSLIWELRSVNHRYLEVSLRLPEDLRGLETAVRDLISKRLGRGKVDGILRFQARDAVTGEFAQDETLVARLTVTAPQKPGSYALQIDLVEEGVTWFADRGSGMATTPVTVKRGQRRLLQRRLPHSEPQPAEPGEPELFTMNGLSRERVERALTGAGCTVVEAVPSSNGGIHWEGYQYFVTNPSP